MQDELRELIMIVNRNRVKQIEVIGNPPARKSKAQELYYLITENPDMVEDEYAKILYGTSATDRNYRALKKRLKERLLNTLFFIDLNEEGYNEQQRAYYSCMKDFSAAKVLIGKSAYCNGVSLMRKVLQKSIRYEFFSIGLEAARQLRIYYGNNEGNHKEFQEYNKICKYCEKVLRAELRAEEYYGDLISRHHTRASNKEEFLSLSGQYAEKVKRKMEKYEAYKLHLVGNLVQLVHFAINKDYRSAIEACQEGIAFFEQKPYANRQAVANLSSRLLMYHLQLREYKEGEQVYLKNKDKLTPGTINWTTNQATFIMLALHTERYQEAFRVFQETTSNPRFGFLPDMQKEKMRILEAYLYYLNAVGKITIPGKMKKFRISRFINQVPIFSKDKRGYNVAILIAQVLFLIKERKHAKVLDRMEAIEKYVQRYLRKGDAYRSSCFIRMLLQIPASGFHRVASERKAQPYLRRLLKNPMDVGQKTQEFEFIPYETLWKLALESL